MGIDGILHNEILLAGITAWLASQMIKTLIHLVLNRRLVWERLVGDGGMPSSHSATVTCVAAMIGVKCGFDSPLFAVAAILAVIVMHDAMGVRQETGKQAKAINDMWALFRHLGAEDQTPEQQLKEFVGHTPMQVAMGFLLGVVVAVVWAVG